MRMEWKGEEKQRRWNIISDKVVSQLFGFLIFYECQIVAHCTHDTAEVFFYIHNNLFIPSFTLGG